MPSSNVIPLALVGYGNIARKHLEVFRELGCEIVAACNRSETGRAQAHEEGGIPRTYSNIPEMLEREQPAGVLCCASYDSMFDVARQVLPTGIPTLLEKPPGLTLGEAKVLAKMAHESGAPVMVGVNRRHYSVLQRAIEDAGGLETITAVMVEWSEVPRVFLERGDPIEAVERLVFANTLHALDTMTYLAGPVPDALIIGTDRGQPLRWQMALQGVSERGALVSLTSTWDSPARWRISFSTPGRRYEFVPLESCRVLEDGRSEFREIESSQEDRKFKPGFFRQANEFIRLINTGSTTEDLSIESVLPAMELAEGLTSACTGGRVTRAET